MAVTKKLTEYGLEPFDKDWGTGVSAMGEDFSPFDRINKLRKDYFSIPASIDAKRALIRTDVMKHNVNKPYNIRCAEAFREVLKTVPLYINGNLILGNIGAPQKAAPIYPEFSYDWVIDELENAPFNQRPGVNTTFSSDRLEYTKETEEALKSIHSFWHGNTVHDLAVSMMTEDQLKGDATYGKALFFPGNYLNSGIGHCCPRYQVLFELGWKGLREKVEKKLAELDLTTPDGIKKETFYKGQLITLEAISIFINRYAAEARELAAKESDEMRKAELLHNAEVCEWIAENPPRTFFEAIQLMWFAICAVQIEGNGHSITYGRFDQLLYPYYQHDMAAGEYQWSGETTKEFIQELIECFYIKVCELNKVRDAGSTQAFGGVGIGGASLTLGGVTPDGEDATNELSFMGVDAIVHTRMNFPLLTTRHHANEPEEWWIKCTKSVKTGIGYPSFFNDEVIIPGMCNRGIPIEDARDYHALGCVEPDVGGREYGWHDMCFFNMNKVLTWAINDGRCIDCSKECPRYSKCAGAGNRIGLATGSLADFKTFDEVLEAYDKQMEYWVENLVGFCNCLDIAHQTKKPLPFLSTMIDDCIDRGTDVTAGGALYNFIGPQGLATGNVADGLAAIKQLIFEEKKVTGAEMLQALKDNWEGHEPLYALVNSSKVHHYGNDDPYADELARFGALSFCKHLEKRPTAHGGIFQPGLYPVTGNVPAGMCHGASPDGRKAGEPEAEGVSAVHTHQACHDVSGPTALVKSVSSLDHLIASNGTLLNMKFTPSTMAGDIGDKNFINLIKVYFERKGFHNQINVVSKEVLEDAVAHPENYSGLLVRVAGYSAFFTELDAALQRDIIERASHEF